MGEVLPGIVSGIIASAILSFVLFGIKPRVKISDQLCRDRTDGTFEIKVVNLSHADLIDVNYTLHHCRRFPDKIGRLTEIAPLKSKLEFLQAYSRSDPYHDYAVRLTYKIPDTLEFAENDSLIFTLYARHALSGTFKFFTKEYSADQILCGVFQVGKNTDIVVTKCNQNYKDCRTATGTNCGYQTPAATK